MNFWGIALLSLSIISSTYGQGQAVEDCTQLNTFFTESTKNSGKKITFPVCCSDAIKCENGHITEITWRTPEVLDIDFSSFPKLPNLNYLALEGSIYKNGVLPSALFDLPNLKKLHIMKSNIKTLNIPKTCSLELLSIYNGSLSGFPSEVLNCKNLETLDLSYNNIGTIPDSISEFQNLKELLLIDSKLTEISDKIFDFKLKTLHLNRNKSLKPKIYNFKGTVGECALDRSIGCYEPGTCAKIVEDPEAKNPTILKESDFEECKDTRDGGSGSKLILVIIGGFVIIIVGLIIGCCCFKNCRSKKNEAPSFKPPTTQNVQESSGIKNQLNDTTKPETAASENSLVSDLPVDLPNTIENSMSMNGNNMNNNNMNNNNMNGNNMNYNGAYNGNTNYTNNAADASNYYNASTNYNDSSYSYISNGYNNSNNGFNNNNNGFNNNGFNNNGINNNGINNNGFNNNGYNNIGYNNIGFNINGYNNSGYNNSGYNNNGYNNNGYNNNGYNNNSYNNNGYNNSNGYVNNNQY